MTRSGYNHQVGIVGLAADCNFTFLVNRCHQAVCYLNMEYSKMKKYLMLVLFSVTVSGCSLLAPKSGDQNITVLPDDPSQSKTVLGEGEPLPEGAIVLPADDIAVEATEIVLPDAEVIEITELEPEFAAPEEQTEIYLPDEVGAGVDAEAVIIPAEDSPSSHSGEGVADVAVRVEILNSSGIPGLEQQVSERLAGKGYFISWAGEGAASGTQHETWIKYRPNFAREAVRLGHVLPGNQIVTRGDELPEEIDIRIIVGSDQQ